MKVTARLVRFYFQIEFTVSLGCFLSKLKPRLHSYQNLFVLCHGFRVGLGIYAAIGIPCLARPDNSSGPAAQGLYL